MISVKNLAKEYLVDETATKALRGISFDIDEGEFVAVMGPSGSGKSTLLHILSFLDRPTVGSYTFLGKSIQDLSDQELAHIRNQEMGFIFQAFNLLSRSSVYQNVEIPLLYSDLPVRERRPRILSAVASVGLSEKLGTEAGRLSGGQKQRVAIARALVNEPAIVFADEPTGNLDSESGGEVMEIFEKLHNQGRTIVLVTHETYTSEFARRLIRLKDGLIEVDEPIVKRHRHLNGEKLFK
ncbi:MAG: ABC transporter ATP-binding protein [Candidatus Sungbacteria bacterium]|uniref:ABC transporter ATP-binding protein n=1 Tax=Candidatus Sungiibacteriota bacterium TaxID=2750080 RepID=A0A9D6LNM4_9BACT|nr:ABC transporter ATP-binding protein [Candidatus Sungbacteria bacterium]